MSMEGSSTNHMLSRGPYKYRTFYIYWLSYRCSFALESNCKTCGKVCVNLKTFIGVIDSDSDSLLFENALVVCWYVIHSQSLTLTSDDLIWSSCGDYYDRTSIVMKIIQKAAELWTAITTQGKHLNLVASKITHCDSEHRQQTTLDNHS